MIELNVQKTLRSEQREFVIHAQLHTDARRIVIHGPSGSGKSTLMKLMAGLLKPDMGAMKINGQVWFDANQSVHWPARDRRVGMLFQDYALFPHLTVRQNMAFGSKAGWRNPQRQQKNEQVDYWLEAMHMQALADQLPHALSGGQRQRVALARALVTQPQILLLDEPFAALDPALREQMRQELDQLLEQLGIPMILITHDPMDIRRFGQEVHHMEAGRLTHSTLEVNE